jgi:hypothetical protein
MNDNEAIERFIGAVELLADATARQAEAAEAALDLQRQMVKNQTAMAKGTAALEKQLTGKRR